MKNNSYILGIILILINTNFIFNSCKKSEDNNDIPPNTNPTAVFTINPDSGNTTTVFNFDASASIDKESVTSELQVRWDWEDDGTWDTDYSTNKLTTHIFTAEGNYTTKLEVIDPEGLTDSTTKNLIVNNGPYCPEFFTDPRDGQTYSAIQIGDQCWMAENINIGNKINGTTQQTNNSIIEKYCYNNNEANCDEYGGLYQWGEMMQYASKDNVQGICPVGWHLPTDIEWMMLEVELGMSMEQATSTGLRGTDEGTKLKAGGSSGFEALLGGYCNSGGQFNSINNYATFFTSSQGSQANLAWTRYLFNDKDQILRNQYEKTFAYSVRCLKD